MPTGAAPKGPTPGSFAHPGNAEPENAAAAMASAVRRLRRMAATVFRGDAALFADSDRADPS